MIYGKTMPYVILGMSNLPLMLAVAMFVFHVPMRGSFLVLLRGGLRVRLHARGDRHAHLHLLQEPAAGGMAGFLFMFPGDDVFGPDVSARKHAGRAPDGWPTWIRLAHYMGLLRNIMLKGGDPRYVANHVAILAVMAVDQRRGQLQALPYDPPIGCRYGGVCRYGRALPLRRRSRYGRACRYCGFLVVVKAFLRAAANWGSRRATSSRIAVSSVSPTLMKGPQASKLFNSFGLFSSGP